MECVCIQWQGCNGDMLTCNSSCILRLCCTYTVQYMHRTCSIMIFLFIQFFRFGISVGDSTILQVLDGISPQINLTGNFCYDEKIESIYVRVYICTL